MMALRSHIGRALHLLGGMVSICLLMLAVLAAPAVVSDAAANTTGGVTITVEAQAPHATTCHSAPACAPFMAPAEISVSNLKQLRTLRVVIFNSMNRVQSGPSSDTPPPRV